MPGRRLSLHRHQRRAGLDDPLRRGIRRARSRRSTGCSRPGSRRCTRPARSRRISRWRRRGWTRSTSLVLWKGYPTVASTETILVNAAQAKAFYLEGNQYVEWDAEAGTYDVVVPGVHQTMLALPWGGTSHPVWFKRDPRVANVKVLGGVFDRGLMQGVPAIVADGARAGQGHPARREAEVPRADRPRGPDADAAAREPADQHLARVGPRVGPARERPRRTARRLQLQADRAAPGLCRSSPDARQPRVGSASLGCQAFGHRELLAARRTSACALREVTGHVASVQLQPARSSAPSTASQPPDPREHSPRRQWNSKASARSSRAPGAVSGWRSRAVRRARRAGRVADLDDSTARSGRAKLGGDAPSARTATSPSRLRSRAWRSPLSPRSAAST